MRAGALLGVYFLATAACRPAAETTSSRCGAADGLPPHAYDSGEDATPDLLAQCASDGLSCSMATLLTRQQAQCRAIELGLPRGVEPLGARLQVDYDFSRPAWILSSTEQLVETPRPHDSDCKLPCGPDVRASGTRISIDARTGRQLDRWAWRRHDDMVIDFREDLAPAWLRWLRRFTP